MWSLLGELHTAMLQRAPQCVFPLKQTKVRKAGEWVADAGWGGGVTPTGTVTKTFRS
jgi:hypothetical protein